MGSGSSKANINKNDAVAERRQELQLWRGKTKFADLPEAGLKAFSEYLSPDDRRRLDFWLKDPNFDSDVLSSYISDGPDMLKDATEDVNVKDEILSKATEVAEYVRGLRTSMEPDLHTEFNKFQKEIDKQLASLSR